MSNEMIIRGLAAPTGQWTTREGHRAGFAVGVFDGFKGLEVPVRLGHGAGRPVVGLAKLKPAPDGLRALIVLLDTDDGRDAWRRVLAGELEGLSLRGEAMYRTTTRDGVEHRLHHRVDSIRELALVPKPSFAEARIWAVGADGSARRGRDGGQVAASGVRRERELDELTGRQLRDMDLLWSRHISGRPAAGIDLGAYTAARRALVEAHALERTNLGRAHRREVAR